MRKSAVQISWSLSRLSNTRTRPLSTVDFLKQLKYTVTPVRLPVSCIIYHPDQLLLEAAMRLTAELIQNSLSYLNPLKERELDLRGAFDLKRADTTL